jgi:hypothetical protein
MTSLAEWDKTIAPYLRAIESYSTGLNSYARSLVSAVTWLPMKPEFETKAEAELANAETVLTLALEIVKEARKTYAEKPTEIRHLQAAE